MLQEAVHAGTMDEAMSAIALLADADAQSINASGEQAALLASKEGALFGTAGDVAMTSCIFRSAVRSCRM